MAEPTMMAVRHRTRENEYKEYTDNIINLMKEFNPRLRDENIVSQEPSMRMEENPSVLAFMNIDISFKDNNNVDINIDRIHIHIPYSLKIEYIKEYIKLAIVYTYFIDRQQGYSLVDVNEYTLRSNISLSSEYEETEYVFSQNPNNIFGTLGDIVLSLYAAGIEWAPSSYNDINTLTKLCVITNDFRHGITTPHQSISNTNFWYDLGSDLNRISNTETPTQINGNNYDGDNNNINVRRNLLNDFNNSELVTNVTIYYGIPYDEIPTISTELTYSYEVQPINLRQGECPVCYEEIEIGNYYNCYHGICCDCFNHWGENGHITCPMCRSNINN